jgi:hypothetical protein
LRKVLFHYHIFKNSGTTFDSAMRKKLGKQFVGFDADPGELPTLQTEIARVIAHHGDAVLFSSHTARLPVPIMSEVKVEPIVFVRHPLLRLRSIYSWFKKTNLKVRLTSLAKFSSPSSTDIARRHSFTSRTFEQWVGELLASKEGRIHISNAQSRFLSGGYDTRPRRIFSGDGDLRAFDLEKAKENLSKVTLLGRTEYFDQDIADFLPVLSRYGIHLRTDDFVPKNITNKNFDTPLEDRVLSTENQLGADLTASLRELLDQDLELYFWVNNTLKDKPAST